jgi:hypothetical protein
MYLSVLAALSGGAWPGMAKGVFAGVGGYHFDRFV